MQKSAHRHDGYTWKYRPAGWNIRLPPSGDDEISYILVLAREP